MGGGPFFLQFVEGFFVGIVPVGQFSFVEVIRGIAVTEFGIVQDVLFCCCFRFVNGVVFRLFSFTCCHIACFCLLLQIMDRAGPAFAMV